MKTWPGQKLAEAYKGEESRLISSRQRLNMQLEKAREGRIPFAGNEAAQNDLELNLGRLRAVIMDELNPEYGKAVMLIRDMRADSVRLQKYEQDMREWGSKKGFFGPAILKSKERKKFEAELKQIPNKEHQLNQSERAANKTLQTIEASFSTNQGMAQSLGKKLQLIQQQDLSLLAEISEHKKNIIEIESTLTECLSIAQHFRLNETLKSYEYTLPAENEKDLHRPDVRQMIKEQSTKQKKSSLMQRDKGKAQFRDYASSLYGGKSQNNTGKEI